MSQDLPRTQAGRVGVQALLATPRRALLGLDFDGTLAEIVADPDTARAHPGAVPALRRLAPLLGGVAVVTGRPAARAVEYAGLADQQGLESLVVLGHYGLERWEARSGMVAGPPPPAGVDGVRRALPAVVEGTDAWVEDKGASLAVHTRRAADPDGLLERLRAPLTALARAHGLVVEPGRRVVELRPPGIDKGVAVRGLIEENDPSVVIFVGDDLGDLAAFDAVDEARAGGRPGLLVCSGSLEVRTLAERADLVVDGPGGVVELLAGWATELS